MINNKSKIILAVFAIIFMIAIPVSAFAEGETAEAGETTTDSMDNTLISVEKVAVPTADGVDNENNNYDKYQISEITGEGSDFETTISELEPLISIESANPAQGEAKWVGVLITTDQEVTSLAVQTPTMDSFGNLGQSDIDEAVSAGAEGTSTFVWWLKAENIGEGQYIKIKSIDDETGANAITLTVKFAPKPVSPEKAVATITGAGTQIAGVTPDVSKAGYVTVDMTTATAEELDTTAAGQQYPNFDNTQATCPVWLGLVVPMVEGATKAVLLNGDEEDYYDENNGIFYVSVGERTTADGQPSENQADYNKFVLNEENEIIDYTFEFYDANDKLISIKTLDVKVISEKTPAEATLEGAGTQIAGVTPDVSKAGYVTVDMTTATAEELDTTSAGQVYPNFDSTQATCPVWLGLVVNMPEGATKAVLLNDDEEDYYDENTGIFYVTVGERTTADGQPSENQADYNKFVLGENSITKYTFKYYDENGLMSVQTLDVKVISEKTPAEATITGAGTQIAGVTPDVSKAGYVTVDMTTATAEELDTTAAGQQYPNFDNTQATCPVWLGLVVPMVEGATKAVLLNGDEEDYYDENNGIFYVSVGERTTADGQPSENQADYNKFVLNEENEIIDYTFEFYDANDKLISIKTLDVKVISEKTPAEATLEGADTQLKGVTPDVSKAGYVTVDLTTSTLKDLNETAAGQIYPGFDGTQTTCPVWLGLVVPMVEGATKAVLLNGDEEDYYGANGVFYVSTGTKTTADGQPSENQADYIKFVPYEENSITKYTFKFYDENGLMSVQTLDVKVISEGIVDKFVEETIGDKKIDCPSTGTINTTPIYENEEFNVSEISFGDEDDLYIPLVKDIKVPANTLAKIEKLNKQAEEIMGKKVSTKEDVEEILNNSLNNITEVLNDGFTVSDFKYNAEQEGNTVNSKLTFKALNDGSKGLTIIRLPTGNLKLDEITVDTGSEIVSLKEKDFKSTIGWYRILNNGVVELTLVKDPVITLKLTSALPVSDSSSSSSRSSGGGGHHSTSDSITTSSMISGSKIVYANLDKDYAKSLKSSVCECTEGLKIDDDTIIVGGPLANALTKEYMNQFPVSITNSNPGENKGIIQMMTIKSEGTGIVTEYNIVLLAGSDRFGTQAAVEYFKTLEEVPEEPIYVEWVDGEAKKVN
ncbi:hypothetical protein J2127_001016 [Methanococcus voltae]|uniref:hypothetical protein n=1 Tax=Methanococcus voltae TaxID=2188 RepID=UPI001AE91C1A|nr:hypothetical protein [Methanococcus voltae]MBP2143848.1 hypothetical protein [Methanococcus voltae]